MSYTVPKHYSDARTLAAAAGCQVLSGSVYSPAVPTAQQAECGFGGATEGDGLSEAMVFTSPQAEATEAGQMAQDDYQSDQSGYAVIGDGWIVGQVSASVTDAKALQVQAATGGVVVCFPGYSGPDC